MKRIGAILCGKKKCTFLGGHGQHVMPHLLCSVFLILHLAKYRCKKKAHSVNQTWYDTVLCERTVNEVNAEVERGSQQAKPTSM